MLGPGCLWAAPESEFVFTEIFLFFFFLLGIQRVTDSMF